MRFVKLYAKAARARLGWSGEEAQLVIKMACGYGINAQSLELQAATPGQGACQLVADKLARWKLTKGQLKHDSGLNKACRDTERWLALIKPHIQHLAAACSAGTSLVANLKHIKRVYEVYLDPKWARQRLRLYRAQDRALEQFFKKLEEDMAEVSMQRHRRAKQLVVFFGAASIGTQGGWGSDAVLRACCKVVCMPRGIGQRQGRVVLVDEHRTSRVSSAVNGQQPCEEEPDHEQPTRLAPRKPPQPLCSSQVATQSAASEPGPNTPSPAKRSKRTEAEQGKAAKAKPAPRPGRWLDSDCNAALDMQRLGESRSRPLELCWLDVIQVLHDCHNSIGPSGCMPTALLPVAASIANQLLSKLAAVLDLYDRRPLDTDDVPVLASGQLWTMGSLLHISSLYSSVRTHAEVLVYKAPMPSSSGLLISSCAAPVVDNTTTPHNSVAQRRRRRALASTHLPEVQELVKPLLPSQPWPAASANHGAELQQWHQSRQVLQGDVSPAPEESSSSTSSSDVDSSDGNSPGSDLEESSMEESSSDGSGSSIDTGGEEGDWGSPSGTTAPPQSVLAFMDMPSTAVYEGPLDANTRQQWEYQALGRFDESGRLLGPQFPRTHLLLLYRLDWEELIAVALALRRLHGFSSGPGNLDDYIAVDEVPPPLGVRLPAGQGSVDVRRWPQPNSLSSNWTLMPPGVPPALNSSEPKMALCLDLALHCKAGDLLAAILASLTQTKGTQQAVLSGWPGTAVLLQGWLLDPVDMSLLTSSPAGAEALRLYARLASLALPLSNPSEPLQSCSALNRRFVQGNCAMTIDWDVAMMYAYNSVDTLDDVAQYGLQGRLGWAPLPGFTKVYDRQGQVLLPCTSELCPHALNEPVQTIAFRRTGTPSELPLSPPPPSQPPHPFPPPPEQGGEVPILDGDGRNQEQPDVRSLPTLDESSLVMADPTLGFTNSSLEAVGVLLFPEPFIALVNRAPYSALADTSVGLCRSGSSLSSTQLQALNDLFLSGPLVARQAFMAASDRVMRSAYLRATAGNTTPPAAALDGQFGNLGIWSRGRLRGTNTSLFLNAQDSLRYFNTLWRVRFAWPGNQAPQATLTDSTTQYVRMALSEAALAGLVSGLAQPQLFTPLNTSLRLTARLQQAMALEPSGTGVNSTITGPAAVRALYRKSIGYLPPPAPPSAPPPPSSFPPPNVTQPSQPYNATDTKLISYIVSGVVSVLVLAGIGLVALLLVRRAQRRSLLGRIQAPDAGPGTTLLITDIQDSTVIWETLPADVTDQAVKLHHEVVRQSFIAHRGYECCTEGDSFILAFHTPNDAARFAVTAQAALVLAPWPQELYELEVCKPVWVSPVTNSKSLPQLLSTQPHLLDERRKPRHSLTLPTSASWAESSAQDAPKPHIRRNAEFFLTIRGPMRRFRDMSRTTPALSVDAGAPSGECSDRFASGSSPFQWEQSYANPAIAAGMTDSSGTSALQRARATWTPLQNTATESADGIPPRLSGDCDSIGAWIAATDDGCSSLASGPVAMHEHLKRLVPVATGPGPGPGRVLIFQGLRVRMGMASGTSSAEEVTFNASLGGGSMVQNLLLVVLDRVCSQPASLPADSGHTGCQAMLAAVRDAGRVKYGGALMAAAKAIQDAAQGGMVLATSSTFKQLSVESLGSELLVISMGEHVLKAGEEAVQVYHLLNQALSYRAFHLGAVRSVAQSSLGMLQAPYGQAAVCFMNAVGVGILEAWNPTVAAAALKLYQGCAQAALCQHGGYLMEAVDGLCLAAFGSPAAAVRWALDTLTRCLELDWPPELLEHELGEAVEVMSVNKQGTTSPQAAARSLARASCDGLTELAGRATPSASSGRVYQLQVHKLLFRGLRVKVGIDYGPVHADLHAVTGRVTYRGKAMNRAARICGSAKSGQVWASSGAWHAAQHDLNNCVDSLSYRPAGTEQATGGVLSAAAAPLVAATNLGSYKLKGIKEDMSLMRCFYEETQPSVHPLRLAMSSSSTPRQPQEAPHVRLDMALAAEANVSMRSVRFLEQGGSA
ncbi:hypothetical protein QJQ45_001777 [Haematococcus lacustris]|nr:hypothetical protein QJQ45_001777 [Haematococcus lacustris]